jgi:hypothetical protein
VTLLGSDITANPVKQLKGTYHPIKDSLSVLNFFNDGLISALR